MNWTCSPRAGPRSVDAASRAARACDPIRRFGCEPEIGGQHQDYGHDQCQQPVHGEGAFTV